MRAYGREWKHSSGYRGDYCSGEVFIDRIALVNGDLLLYCVDLEQIGGNRKPDRYLQDCLIVLKKYRVVEQRRTHLAAEWKDLTGLAESVGKKQVYLPFRGFCAEGCDDAELAYDAEEELLSLSGYAVRSSEAMWVDLRIRCSGIHYFWNREHIYKAKKARPGYSRQ